MAARCVGTFNEYLKQLKKGRDILHMDTFNDLSAIELWKRYNDESSEESSESDNEDDEDYEE